MTRLEALEKNMPRIRGLASNVYLTNDQRTEAAVFAIEIPFLWSQLEEANAKIEKLEKEADDHHVAGIQRAAVFVSEPYRYAKKFGRTPRGISQALGEYWNLIQKQLREKRG